jgi:hypothetical protein
MKGLEKLTKTNPVIKRSGTVRNAQERSGTLRNGERSGTVNGPRNDRGTPRNDRVGTQLRFRMNSRKRSRYVHDTVTLTHQKRKKHCM